MVLQIHSIVQNDYRILTDLFSYACLNPIIEFDDGGEKTHEKSVTRFM